MTDLSGSSPLHRRTRPHGGAWVWTRGGMLLFGFTAFLLAPKIDVISVLRIEDLVFLLVLPVLIWRYTPDRTPFPGYLKWYFAYLGLATLSAIANYSSLGLFGIINVVRQVQYLIWFAVGAQMAASISTERFHRAITIVGIIFILWWLGEMAGIIPKIGKFTGAQGRVTLNTSGPYEISVVVVFVMLFVKNRAVLLGLIGILIATQSRITLAAALVVYLIKNPRNALIVSVPVALLVVTFLLLDPSALAESRFAEIMSPLEMWQAWRAQLLDAPVIVDLPEYRYYAYDSLWEQVDGNIDVSFEIRLIRWALIVKSLTSDWMHLSIGWGPGAWGAAVDSHLIRFLGEVGVLGTAIFTAFVAVSVFHPGYPAPYRTAMMILVICSLFIDVMTSSKIMSFLWGFAGYTTARMSRVSA